MGKKRSALPPPLAGSYVDGKCSACGEPEGDTHLDGCVNAGPCNECGCSAMMGHLEDCSKRKPDEQGNTAGAAAEPAPKNGKKVTVDGQEAQLRTAPPAKEPPGNGVAPQYPPIFLVDGAWEALQKVYDDGDFSGDTQQQKKCEYQYVIGGTEYQCPHVAVIEKKLTEVCPECERKGKKHVAGYCLGHAINVLGGGHPARLQTELNLAGTKK